VGTEEEYLLLLLETRKGKYFVIITADSTIVFRVMEEAFASTADIAVNAKSVKPTGQKSRGTVIEEDRELSRLRQVLNRVVAFILKDHKYQDDE